MPHPDDFIRRIHRQGKQFVLAFTGGGSGAIGELLRVPGGSQSLLEAVVPYSQAALVDWLKSPPEHYCAERTARAMAMACWQRARKLAPESPPDALVGMGCTASLASDRPKKGAHRAFLACQTSWKTVSIAVELTRDARSRADEEDLVAGLAINLIGATAGLADRLELPLLPNEQVQRQAAEALPAWRELLLGNVRSVLQNAGAEVGGGRAIFPGAFNPLHDGHRQMAALAQFKLQLPVQFELSIENVDKPPLDYMEIERRARQFSDAQTPLWLTRAPTFAEKSRLFPGATFLVGADTIVRIGQPRYYGNDAAACEAALREIAANGCRFLVFPRADGAVLHTLGDLELPDALRALCQGISATEFRADVSSTQLRKAAE